MKYNTWLYENDYGSAIFTYIYPTSDNMKINLTLREKRSVSGDSFVIEWGTPVTGKNKDKMILAPEKWNDVMKERTREATSEELAKINNILQKKSHEIIKLLFKGESPW